jgi:subtilase family serine protease
MPLSRLARLAAIGFVLTAGLNTLRAETRGIRISGPIDSSNTVALASSISPRTLAAKDLGEISGDKRLESMTLRFSLTPQQQSALTQLLAEQQDPASPKYHQWLTPEQFASQFGLSSADSGAVASWLAAQGFTVTEVARGGLFVRFSGTVPQAEAAFHTQIHSISFNGEQHFANVTAPTLPAAIASVTQGITGLDDFRPKPHHRQMTIPSPQPEYTASATVHYLAPADFYTIYDEKTLLSNSVTGTGIDIAVVGQSDIYAADIAAFQKAAGLTNKLVTVTLTGTDPGYPSTADLVEAEMDLEWAGAVAPGASILYFNATNVIDGSLTDVVDNNLAPIVSTSYGACEASLGTSAIAYYSVLLQQAATQGMTIIAASGDSGATDCDAPTVGSAVNGLAVDFPASSPLVTGIGGTRLNEGTGTFWSTTNGTNAGSATAYIPEMVWNDDNGAGLDSTGGGASDYFSKPSWQTGTGVPNDYSRDVPDVSLAASIIHDGYLICSGSTNCTNGFANASGGFDVAGGTSVAAPAFAGLMALIEQKSGGKPLGNVNPTIYALANSTYKTTVFHDIVSGTNASPCTTGSVNCAAGGTIGFAATAGYDQATGWGSVDAAALVNDWSAVTPASVTGGVDPSLVNIAGSVTTAIVGTPIIFTVTVAAGTNPSPGTPTGTAQITVDSVPVTGASVALAAGTTAGTATGTYTLATAGYSVGNHTVQATYSGDATFAGSKAAFAITLTPATFPDFSLTPATANVTVKGGTIAQAVVLAVTSLDNFAGSVSFTASSTTPIAATTSFTVNPIAVTAGGSATTAFSLLAYTTTTSKLNVPERPGGWYRTGTDVVLAGLLLLVLPRRRRLPALLLLIVGVATLGAIGCASTPPSTSMTVTTPTPAGTYSVLISATATINGVVTTHSSTITYTVQ